MTGFNRLNEKSVHSFATFVQQNVVVGINDSLIIQSPDNFNWRVATGYRTLHRNSVAETRRLVAEREWRNARRNLKGLVGDGKKREKT